LPAAFCQNESTINVELQRLEKRIEKQYKDRIELQNKKRPFVVAASGIEESIL